jgi:hypothetical protein
MQVSGRFNIGQNYDQFIIKSIRDYFGGTTEVRAIVAKKESLRPRRRPVELFPQADIPRRGKSRPKKGTSPPLPHPHLIVAEGLRGLKRGRNNRSEGTQTEKLNIFMFKWEVNPPPSPPPPPTPSGGWGGRGRVLFFRYHLSYMKIGGDIQPAPPAPSGLGGRGDKHSPGRLRGEGDEKLRRIGGKLIFLDIKK